MKFLLIFSIVSILACSKQHEETEQQISPNPVPTVVPSPSPSAAPEQEYKYDVILGADGLKYHTGLKHPEGEKETKGFGKLHVSLADCDNLPEEFDLRKIGTVSDIRDQGSCGSCWSFSKTGSLESALMAAGGKPLDLSEQELVSCDKSQWGCEGGILADFKYQIEKGQSIESDLPYTSGRSGRNGSCPSGLKPAAKAVNFAYIGSPNRGPSEKELMCALFKTHTVPWITVSASGAWGSPPSSEDKMYSRCGRGQTNHAVGVVGWKKINGKLGFIMKNSWGTSWGAKGYMMLPLGCDAFGDEAAYVITDATPCKPPMIKLPVSIGIQPGVEVLLGVKDESAQGWSYEWFVGDKKVGDGSQMYVTPDKDTVYKLVAKNKCGTAESSTLVHIVAG